MRLKQHFLNTIQTVQLEEQYQYKQHDLISLLDLTCLNEDATKFEIQTLAFKAINHQTAALCVLPKHLPYLPNTPSNIKRVTVANFPHGNMSHPQVLDDMKRLLKTSAIDEIDYVFAYQNYIQGHRDQALSYCSDMYELCRAHNIVFKVILETGVFSNPDLLFQASIDVIRCGADFLKTSTGTITPGATLETLFFLALAVKQENSSCGLKVSGGITTYENALEMIHLAEHMLKKSVNSTWFRIGASSLLEQLLNTDTSTSEHR